MKKVYLSCALSALVLVLFAFAIQFYRKPVENSIKIGVIYLGDQVTPYTDNFIKTQNKMQDEFGDSVEFIAKYNVPEDQIEGPLNELIRSDCEYIIAPSYGYGEAMKRMAEQHPEIEFCVPTQNNANVDPILKNYHTCMGQIYQGRYICGVVAGMKLKEMIDNGIITPQQAKVGYVAAFPYAEVISGYTAFFLGIRSVVPEATMLVKYTNTWSSYLLEKNVANELIEQECILISQHSDTTGPAVACENAKGNIPVYHVGYNQSMTEIAPTRSLVSCSIDYEKYFRQSIRALLNEEEIEKNMDAKVHGQDVMAGFEKDWIKILDVNTAIAAPGTEEAIIKLKKEFMEGRVKVFYGNYTGTDPFHPSDKINLQEEYIENATASAPSFHYVLDDVITVIE